jgi:predicted small lipoprotein YifL
MPVRTLFIVLLAATALVCCGRRGPLEEPGTPAGSVSGISAAPVNDGTSPLDPGSTVTAGPMVSAPQPQTQPSPRRRFFLDFLL